MAARLAALRDLDTEAWSLPGAEILQLAFEVPRDTHALLPRAMHPAIPPYATILVTRYPESPVGPFVLAQVRLMGRAGAHPRGLVLGAIASTADAARELAARWGVPAVAGGVTLTRRHDRGTATVVTLARAPLDGVTAPRLLQVVPRYTFHKAERGRPTIRALVAEAWQAGPLRPQNPISATACTCDTDLPRIRFVMAPEIPVIRGTRKIRDAREAG